MINPLFIHYAIHEYCGVPHNLLLGFPTDCSARKLRWRHPWHSSTQTPIIHPPESGKSLNVKLLEKHYRKLLITLTIMVFFSLPGMLNFQPDVSPVPGVPLDKRHQQVPTTPGLQGIPEHSQSSEKLQFEEKRWPVLSSVSVPFHPDHERGLGRFRTFLPRRNRYVLMSIRTNHLKTVPRHFTPTKIV